MLQFQTNFILYQQQHHGRETFNQNKAIPIRKEASVITRHLMFLLALIQIQEEQNESLMSGSLKLPLTIVLQRS